MNILYVCTANRFRSQAAAIISKGCSSKHRVRSCGVGNGPFGLPVPKKLQQLLEEMEYYISPRAISKSMDDKLADWADKIVYMQPSHQKILAEQYANPSKLVCLADFANQSLNKIPDPAFDAKGFDSIIRLIETCVKSFLRTL